MSAERHTALVKTLAQELGFSYCGIARAMRLDDDARRLEAWLNKGMQGSMSYMENHFELRVDPTRLVPGARSVITLLFNYLPAEERTSSSYKISRYAFGNDYHEVIRPRLRMLLQKLEAVTGPLNGRGFVDSAPVLERTWALRSGLGWIGKNGNLITPKAGSWYFIATLITDLPLVYDDPFVKDHCGTCTRCIDACPTNAIKPGRVVDGSQCISYFTIELKNELIEGASAEKFNDWIFGCDICQEVCPWNRFATHHNHEELAPNEAMMNFSDQDWEELTEEQFRKYFRNSPLKRPGYKRLMRNLYFVKYARKTVGEQEHNA
jgi:epoxyqueuosine reductase